MKKKLLSVLLSLGIMATAALPGGAFAAEGERSYIAVAAGICSFAIDSDHTLWGWGLNYNGYLGDGTEDNTTSPVKIMDDVAAVTSNVGGTTMAIKTDGSLWAWGTNRDGQIGDGTRNADYRDRTQDKNRPVKIMDSVVSVSLGRTHAMAITTDGSLWGWGDNSYGQLGLGTTTDSYLPVKIMGGVSAVAAGWCYTLVVKTDGSLWTCGENLYGSLGDGTSTDRSTPVKIMDSVQSVSAGGYQSMAVKTDGSLWGWGVNDVGQVGNGAAPADNYSGGENVRRPQKIMDGVACVTAGATDITGAAIKIGYTLAVKTDGSLWAWGGNHHGQLGDGTITKYYYDSASGKDEMNDRYAPVKIMDGVSAAAPGDFYALAVRTDGSLWAWGSDGGNYLGDGTQPNQYSPGKLAFGGSGQPTEGGTADEPVDQPNGGDEHQWERPSPWAQTDVDDAIALSLVPVPLQAGYTMPATRAEFCALAVKLFETVKGREITERRQFADTEDINIQKMGGLQVVSGVGGDLFSPEGIITREQAAVILANLMRAMGLPVSNQAPPTFADNADISTWATTAVGGIAAASVMRGGGNNTFSPKGTYTREQSIITLIKLYYFNDVL